MALLALIFFALPAFAREPDLSGKAGLARESRPNGIMAVALGRSLVFGAELNRVLAHDWLLGVAASRVESQNDASVAIGRTFLVPLYVSRYFSREDSSFFLSAGASWVVDPENVRGGGVPIGGLRFSARSWMPNAGFGYEVRRGDGFLLRVDGLVIEGDGFFLSSGVSLGYAF